MCNETPMAGEPSELFFKTLRGATPYYGKTMVHANPITPQGYFREHKHLALQEGVLKP